MAGYSRIQPISGSPPLVLNDTTVVSLCSTNTDTLKGELHGLVNNELLKNREEQWALAVTIDGVTKAISDRLSLLEAMPGLATEDVAGFL